MGNGFPRVYSILIEKLLVRSRCFVRLPHIHFKTFEPERRITEERQLISTPKDSPREKRRMSENLADDTQTTFAVFNMVNRLRTISKRESPKKSSIKRSKGNSSTSGTMAAGKNLAAASAFILPTMAGFKTVQGIKYLNSYHLHSKNPFNPEKVQKILQDIMDERLTDLVYEPNACTKLCVDLAAEIRAKVKTMQFERYKLICLVQICEKNNQSVVSQSKFLWDSERDKYAAYSFENATILAAALVYGIYYE